MTKIIFDLNGTLVREMSLKYGVSEKFSLYPGIFELIGELSAQGHELFIWTMASKRVTAEVLAQNALGPYFSQTQCLEDGFIKPDRRGIINLVGKDSSAVIIGDSRSDMQAGVNAGITSIGALWGQHVSGSILGQSGAKKLAHTPNEILKMI